MKSSFFIFVLLQGNGMCFAYTFISMFNSFRFFILKHIQIVLQSINIILIEVVGIDAYAAACTSEILFIQVVIDHLVSES